MPFLSDLSPLYYGTAYFTMLIRGMNILPFFRSLYMLKYVHLEKTYLRPAKNTERILFL